MAEKRLIDASALYDKVEQKYKVSHGIVHSGYREFLDMICDAPTMDDAKVVCCEDCQHWEEKTGWCEHHSHFIGSEGEACHPWESREWKFFPPDYFCKDGKRKRSESNEEI